MAVVDAPMVARELAEHRLRRIDNHELTASHGYWFVEPRNIITRIKTTVSEPALGDFNIEHESTNQQQFGDASRTETGASSVSTTGAGGSGRETKYTPAPTAPSRKSPRYPARIGPRSGAP